MSKADDELVWALTGGSRLLCIRDMVMEGSGEVAFVHGTTYSVTSMHPLLQPPCVRVRDEQGMSHALEPNDLRGHFEKA